MMCQSIVAKHKMNARLFSFKVEGPTSSQVGPTGSSITVTNHRTVAAPADSCSCDLINQPLPPPQAAAQGHTPTAMLHTSLAVVELVPLMTTHNCLGTDQGSA